VEAKGRVRIKLLVSQQPGLHLRELQRQIGLSFSSTRYHVDKLVKDREIDLVEDNRYSRIYPAGLDHNDRVLLSLVRRQTDQKILSCFLKENSLSQQRLTDLTRLAKSTISEHLATLIELGVLKTQLSERRRTFELTDQAEIDRMLNRYPKLLEKATRRFIDLWEF
jgi:predicted transcriptional regulator